MTSDSMRNTGGDAGHEPQVREVKTGETKTPLILIVDDNTMDRRIAGGILTKQLGARILYAQRLGCLDDC